MTAEYRSFEFRADPESGVIIGTVVPYNQTAQIGGFYEKFLPGSISYDDVVCNRQHNRLQPIARTGGGGLELIDSPTELRARIDPANTVDGKDTRALVKAKILRGLSAEFRAVRDSWQGNERTIHEAILTGIGIVDKAAYGGATLQEQRQAVAWLQAGHLRAVRGAPALWQYL